MKKSRMYWTIKFVKSNNMIEGAAVEFYLNDELNSVISQNNITALNKKYLEVLSTQYGNDFKCILI